MSKHIYRYHGSDESGDGKIFSEQAEALMAIFLRREKIRGHDVIIFPNPKDGALSEPEFRKDGLLTYIANGLDVPNPPVSNWLHGSRHMPVEYLEDFDRLMQLDKQEKRALYRAVILPEETRFDKLFRLKASLGKMKPGEVLMKVRDNCCLSPEGEMVGWKDVMDRLPPEEWLKHKTLTNDVIQDQVDGLKNSTFNKQYANATEVLRVLDAVSTITAAQKLAFVRAYMLPKHVAPRFGQGTPNKGSGDIMQELIRTHALGVDGKVHTWRWLNEQAEKKDNPHILADAEQLNAGVVSDLLIEALHKAGEPAPKGSHQMVHYWISGHKPSEPLRTTLFDLFSLTEEQREIYNESPSMPANRAREHAFS